MSQITKFSDIRIRFKDHWADSISIDKLMIEAHVCPKCFKPLKYQGFANVAEYCAYGICEPCDFAKLFWIEKAEVSGFKKKVCEAVKIVA